MTIQQGSIDLGETNIIG